jgi:hypothetical protein
MPTIRESLQEQFAALAGSEDSDAGAATVGAGAQDDGGSAVVDEGAAPPQGSARTDDASGAGAGAASDRPRDGGGRFVSRNAPQAAPAAGAGVDAAADPAAAAQAPAADPRFVAPPASWKPEHRAKWDAVAPEVREYIHQREEEMARGVEPLKRVWNTLTPYMPLIQQSGRPPEAVVGDVMHTVALLRTGDPQTKFDLWMNIGKAYGVPTEKLTAATGQQDQAQLDPHTAQLMGRIDQLQAAVGGFQQQQQQAVTGQAQSMLAEFAKTHPHLDALGPAMGQLIGSGVAADLESAYDIALYQNKPLWNQAQAQQREADQRAQREAADKAAKAARRSAVSPRSATPSAGAGAGGNQPASRRELIAQNLSAIAGGRI